MAKTTTTEEISILEISEGTASFAIVGKTPLIFNRMSLKAQHELLMPKGRKNAAERAANLKHNPMEEYRNSVHRSKDDKAPTRITLPAPAFKGAMSTAALRIPGTKKTEIGQLVWVQGRAIDIYGVPQLFMSVVRSADINKTPDIRTRAIIPEWACLVTVSFIRPQLNAQGIARLMAAGGIVAGVGDFRQEKGKGSFGQFRATSLDDADYKRIIKGGGRKAQDAALSKPLCYDDETEELLSWFAGEVTRIHGRAGLDFVRGKPGQQEDSEEEAA